MVPLRVVLLVVAATSTAAAQTPFSAAITGTVRDATPAMIAGAAVSITAPTLIGGTQTVTTNERGEYRFALLPPGLYEVSASASGFRPVRRTGVRVLSGATLTIDFAMEVAGITDEVIIRGGAPVVDVKSAAVPVRLDEALLQNLPTERSIASMINLAPGVAADVAFGGSQNGNEILLDGVRTTTPTLQDPVVRANYNWVQDMNVVSLGAPAEYGGFTGAAGYATLRSGANRFSGLGELWTTQSNWLSNNTRDLSQTLQTQFASRRIHDWYDSSAQVGGPIVHDRLFFFAGLQRYRHNDTPAGYSGPGSTDERDLQTIVRPTAALSASVRLDGFVEVGRHNTEADSLGPAFPLETSSDIENPQTTWNAHVTWTAGNSTVIEARTGGFDQFYFADTHPPGGLNGPAPHYDIGLGHWLYNANYLFRQDMRVTTSTASLTHLTERGPRGRHEIKAGVEHEATDGSEEQRYPQDSNYYDNFGEPLQLQVWGGYSSSATTSRWVAHVQDTWTVGDRLTLSPGARFEWNRGSVPNQPNVFRTSTVAPRIGAAWDLGAVHRTVARVHYGLYFDPIFSSRIMAEDMTDESTSITYAWQDAQWVEVNRFPPQDTFAIDPDLEHSHVKQFVLGLEHELMPDFSLQAQYIRRRFDTFMGLIDTGSVYAPAQRPDPGPDGALNTADDGGMLDVFALTNPGNGFYVYANPDEAFNKYDAVQVVGRKRYAGRWQLQTSYTWSRNRGTVGNRWHVNAARHNLGRPGNFVNPNSFINAYGRAAFDPTHEAKVLGSYRLPWWGGTMVSGVYRYTTGQAWGRTAFITGLPQGGEGVRIEPTGTRRAPAISRVDLRLEKTTRLPGTSGTLGLFFDLFNLFNQAVPDSDITNPIVQNSGARFGQPSAWVDPRMLRVGARVVF
jgi:hypothetical protein